MKKTITDEDILKIKKIYEFGEVTQKEIADAWGIDQSHVSRIVRGLRRQKIAKLNEVC